MSLLLFSCNSDDQEVGYQELLTSSGPVKFSLRMYDENDNDLLANGSIKEGDIKVTYPNYRSTNPFSIDEDETSKYLTFLLEQPDERKINQNISKDFNQVLETSSYLKIKDKEIVIKAEIMVYIGAIPLGAEPAYGNSSAIVNKVWCNDKIIYQKTNEGVEQAISSIVFN